MLSEHLKNHFENRFQHFHPIHKKVHQFFYAALYIIDILIHDR